MKKFVSKAVAVLLAMTMVFGAMTVSAAHEMAPGAHTRDGVWFVWTPPADVITEAVTAVIYHTAPGNTFPVNFSVANSSEGVGWWVQGEQENPGPRLSESAGRIVFDLASVNGGGLQLGIWADDSDNDEAHYFAFITRVVFYGPGGAAVAVAGTVNPQTGDTSTLLWLGVSGVGLVASLAALFFVFKKK